MKHTLVHLELAKGAAGATQLARGPGIGQAHAQLLVGAQLRILFEVSLARLQLLAPVIECLCLVAITAAILNGHGLGRQVLVQVLRFLVHHELRKEKQH